MAACTTRIMAFYIARSTTVLENRFSKRRGGNFAIIEKKIIFHVVHFKAVINNRLRMYGSDKLVITYNEVNDGF